jgi:hypothetical protein
MADTSGTFPRMQPPDERPPRSREDLVWTVVMVLLWAIAIAGVLWLLAATFAD